MPVVLRPIEEADIPALVAFHAAVEAADDLGEYVDAAELREDLVQPGTEVLGAFDGEELVGSLHVVSRGGAPQVLAFGATRPDRRGEGIGSRLVAAAIERAEVHRRAFGTPVTVISAGRTGNEAQAALLAAFGFAAERWSFEMRAVLGAAQDAGDPPAGYVVRALREDDGERFRRAHNEAFLDHPNSSVWTPAEWEALLNSESFQPAVTFLLAPEDDPDAIVSYIGTHEYSGRREATGCREACIARVGTLPAHRGRGLAGWLLRHSLAAYRAAGYDEAVLGVDTENPTGALRLYERAGFVAERQFTQYLRELTGQ